MGLRVSVDLYEWLKDYSNRTGQSMSVILKDYLESLKRKDERAQRKTQEATP